MRSAWAEWTSCRSSRAVRAFRCPPASRPAIGRRRVALAHSVRSTPTAMTRIGHREAADLPRTHAARAARGADRLRHQAAASRRRNKRMSCPAGNGRIHANLLWEMGGAERVITGVLEGAKGLIHGLTCGAGMPYRLSDIAAQVRRALLPDRLVRPRVQCALEACVFQGRERCSAAWCMRIRGWRAGITACQTARIRRSPEDPFPRVFWRFAR